MDQGTSALWAASLVAGTSLIALWVNSRSARRQGDAQRDDANQQLSQKSKEIREQREYYDRELKEILKMVSNSFVGQQLARERVDVYKEFALWYYSTFYDWLYRSGEWTDELHNKAIAGPPPEVLAPLVVLAPSSFIEEYEYLRNYISERRPVQVSNDPTFRRRVMDMTYAFTHDSGHWR